MKDRWEHFVRHLKLKDADHVLLRWQILTALRQASQGQRGPSPDISEADRQLIEEEAARIHHDAREALRVRGARKDKKP